MMFGIQDLHGIAGEDIAGLQFLGTLRFDTDGLRAFGMKLQPDLFEIEDHLCHILFDTGNRRKFMKDTVDFDGGDGSPLQRGK